jgi:hypothetical protein
MIEEYNHKKNRKEDNKSSVEMIDSFFGSDSEKKRNNQEKLTNFKETEKMIDKILQDNDSMNQHNESLEPTVEISEKDTPNPSDNEKELAKNQYENNNFQQVKKDLKKEEIFEIDKPKTDKPTDNRKINSDKKRKHTTKKLTNNLKDKKQNNDGKIKFSFNFPKFNFKFAKKNEKQKKVTQSKKAHLNEKQKDTSFQQSQKPPVNTPKQSGRMHGISEIKKEEQITQKKQSEPDDKKRKKKISRISNKSINIFRKNTGEKTKESIESQKTNQNLTSQEEHNKTNQKPEPNETSSTIDDDIIQLLKITDDLLGKLPDEVIEEFSQSEDFALYEKVMKKYEILK